MKIAISGGTGFIGRHLMNELLHDGDEVILISRSRQKHSNALCLTWQEVEQDPAALENLDAFVNLAGESINQRWTEQAKEHILQSRLIVASRVAGIVEKLQNKPKVVINGSGMSIYGTSETETFNETSPEHITDFLASVVKKWEKAADLIRGTRLVKLRIGIVLGADGGALPKMLFPYKMGVGGRVGSGSQWMSWIHIKDIIGIIKYCIVHDDIAGPVNCTSPEPVRNEDFGRAIGRAYHRPHWMPVPSLIMKIAFGEMSVLLLKGQKVLPTKISAHGYPFQFPDIDAALDDIAKA